MYSVANTTPVFPLSKEFLEVPLKRSLHIIEGYIVLTGGIPLSIQCCIKLILSTRSLTHAASGLSEG